ncbi:MAG: methylamine dehydrogenase (amicyanin) light chain [Deltaproteobacteria bacterium]|nr:methylamine dehydrogenase (amicyanin) light chain [Deltaproteobacteria bacterium]MBW2389965.1 methylamine dehydrogenase (amicyanin) light chain [Deltaproteobacteria bacterium]MBW2723005.1 methylamine dehydrogenase (amicyanin) light chain [Deltaproteobacteria bacterium]
MNANRIGSALAIVGAAVALLIAGNSMLTRDAATAETQDRSTAGAEPDPSTPEGDPTSADYWRYCSIDGFPASACGGTVSSCPPGTMMSPVTWVGTCRNPADEKDYIVSYNDCCGKGPCGGAFIHRNEGDKPVYYAQKSNDVGWCMGSADAAYNSTVSIVIGVADGPDH